QHPLIFSYPQAAGRLPHLLAQSGHANHSPQCLLLGVNSSSDVSKTPTTAVKEPLESLQLLATPLSGRARPSCRARSLSDPLTDRGAGGACCDRDRRLHARTLGCC